MWAPGQGRPSPSVPSECGQQDPRSGGDESPPALAGATAHCLCEGWAPGKVSATPPFLCPYRYPAAALGSTSGHSQGLNRFTSPSQRESLSFVPSGSSPPHSAEGLSVKGGSGAVKASMGPTETKPLKLCLVFV